MIPQCLQDLVKPELFFLSFSTFPCSEVTIRPMGGRMFRRNSLFVCTRNAILRIAWQHLRILPKVLLVSLRITRKHVKTDMKHILSHTPT